MVYCGCSRRGPLHRRAADGADGHHRHDLGSAGAADHDARPGRGPVRDAWTGSALRDAVLRDALKLADHCPEVLVQLIPLPPEGARSLRVTFAFRELHVAVSPRRAGHGVAVVLKIYTHCIDGQADAANQRIADALGAQDTRRESEAGDEGGDDVEQASNCQVGGKKPGGRSA